MQIEQVRLEDIKPYENNPRLNDNVVEAVANSIREFGFKNPIIVDAEGVIVAGHTRYKAAQADTVVTLKKSSGSIFLVSSGVRRVARQRVFTYTTSYRTGYQQTILLTI